MKLLYNNPRPIINELEVLTRKVGDSFTIATDINCGGYVHQRRAWRYIQSMSSESGHCMASLLHLLSGWNMGISPFNSRFRAKPGPGYELIDACPSDGQVEASILRFEMRILRTKSSIRKSKDLRQVEGRGAHFSPRSVDLSMGPTFKP